MVDYLGWAATVVFVLSYFCKRASMLRQVQMIGALMWTVYGVYVHAAPVVVANLLVFVAAAWTATQHKILKLDDSCIANPEIPKSQIGLDIRRLNE